MPQGAPIPFEGVLNCWNDEHDLPDLLLFIGRSAKTGTLQFSNPESDKTLHFKNGKIVFAESSSQDDGLGQFLLRTGKISLMDYTRVAKKIRPGKRFGKILVEEKTLASQDLVPAVVGQVRGILLGLFRRTETWYKFKEMELPPSQSVTLDLPVARIILEGVRYVESWRRISKGVGNLDSVYRRSDTKAAEWSRMKLDARVRELLDMMEEPVSLEEICTRATLPDFEACRYLWAFRSLSWIELVDVTEQALTDHAIPMTTPPEPVITALPVEADRPTRASLRREAKAAVRATELVELEIEQDSSAHEPANKDAQTQLANEPPPSMPTTIQSDQTQLAVEPPTPARPDQTQLAVEPPLSTPPPNQTQHMVEAPAPPPSTGEIMETILEGGTPTPVPPQAHDDRNDTPFFQMPATPTSSAPTAAPSGFEALATDPVTTKARMPAEVTTHVSVRTPVSKLGETKHSLTGMEAEPAPLEAGFLESFAAQPPVETAKVPKAPHTQELELDPDGIDEAFKDD